MTAWMARSGIILAPVLSLFVASPSQAEVKTVTIEYKDGDTILAGLLAWDDAASGRRPGVLRWTPKTGQLAKLDCCSYNLLVFRHI